MWVEGEDQNCRQGEVRDHESETSRIYRKVCLETSGGKWKKQ